MEMAPSTAALIAGGVSAAGSIVSGIAQNAQSKREAAVYDSNAKLAEQQAAAQAAATRSKALRVHGQQQAAAGASGIALAGSSFADAMADSDYEAELDAQTQAYNGRLEARNYRSRATEARSNAEGAIFDGLFGAGSTALGTYGKWKRLSTIEAGDEA
jgi:hypothetical protein